MFTERIFYSKIQKDGYLKYYHYSNGSDEKQPLIIYLHGAGSRGNELSQIARVGVLGEIDKGRNVPAVVVAPQCYKDTWFDLYNILDELIDSCIENENIDKTRVYACGMSMGGYASWQLAMSNPDRFAALVPVCGGGMYWNAGRLKNLPIWAFHGALDPTVLPEESIKMVRAVNNNGGNAKITIYPDKEHNSWDSAFGDDCMWEWMFSQQRSDGTAKTAKTAIITND